MITGSDCPSTQSQHATKQAFLLVPAIKRCIYISSHFLTSQPTLIKLDNENIGGHVTPLHKPSKKAVVTSYILTSNAELPIVIWGSGDVSRICFRKLCHPFSYHLKIRNQQCHILSVSSLYNCAVSELIQYNPVHFFSCPVYYNPLNLV